MSKHTKGPWNAVHTETKNFVTAHGWIVADVCISKEQRWEVTEANARLIAAAPELLEAAKKALHALHTLGVPVIDGAPYNLHALEDAIDKAEGVKK